MPIYAYRCEACGFAKDVLQKMSDDTLTICPSCGQDAYRKQVTAAGFQLKGSGWYVTDFRNGSGGTAKPAVGTGDAGKEGGASGPSSDSASAAPATATPAASAAASSTTPAAAAPAPASKPIA
jgi:putative FmdB family regulatory protein